MSAPAAGAQSHGDAITTVTSTPVSPFVFLRGRGQFDPFLFRASVPNPLYFFGADLPLRAFYAATVLLRRAPQWILATYITVALLSLLSLSISFFLERRYY
jgi:hypothetical protein